MKYALIIFSIILLAGCAERNTTAPPDPPNFEVISETQTPGWARGISLTGDTAFVADDQQGTTIWDISDLSKPLLIDTVSVFEYSRVASYAPLNNIVFQIEKANLKGYKLLPDSAQQLLTISELGLTDFWIHEIAVDTVFMLMTEDQGFKKYVLSTSPFNPPWLEIGFRGVLAEGNYQAIAADIELGIACLAQDQFGFDIVEVNTDFGVPPLLGSIDTPGAAKDVAMNSDGTVAVVADFQTGLQVLDISDTQNPLIVGNVLPEGTDKIERVALAGDTAYFIDRYNGFFSADISDPANPLLIGHYESPEPEDILVRDDHTIFLVDSDLGLLILRHHQN